MVRISYTLILVFLLIYCSRSAPRKSADSFRRYYEPLRDSEGNFILGPPDKDTHTGSFELELTESQAVWVYGLGQTRCNTANRRHPACKPVNATKNGVPLKLTTNPTNGKSTRLVRKEYRLMTETERQLYHHAFRTMKQELFDDTNVFDVLAKLHPVRGAPNHMGAGFLPWHREFITRFEQALQEYAPNVGLPFWDPTLERHLPEPADSILWVPELLGDVRASVTRGNFANWPITTNCVKTNNGQHNTLKRKVTLGRPDMLFSDEVIDNVMNKSSFADVITYKNPTFEPSHNNIHYWIGGGMVGIECASQDPLFYLLHSFMDNIWENFRQNSQKTDLETDYPIPSVTISIGPETHLAFRPMKPFEGVLNIDGLSKHYTRDVYTYGPRPVKCQKAKDCGSKYLWCDVQQTRCKSKVRPGGNCTGLPSEACFDSKCLNRTCQK